MLCIVVFLSRGKTFQSSSYVSRLWVGQNPRRSLWCLTCPNSKRCFSRHHSSCCLEDTYFLLLCCGACGDRGECCIRATRHVPRLLLLTFIHTRHQTTPPASDMINTANTPPPNPPRPSSSRNPLGGRRVGAPRDIPGDAFEARVRAFLQGRF